MGAKSAGTSDVCGGSFPHKRRLFPLSCRFLISPVLSRIIREVSSRLRAAVGEAPPTGGTLDIKTPLSCLDAHNLEVSSRSCVAVSPFLTGKITKGAAQVEHLFKRDGGTGGRGDIYIALFPN
jgi:hypothetical protein